MTGKFHDPENLPSERPEAAEPHGPNSPLTPSFDPLRILAQTPAPVVVARNDGAIEFASNQWFSLTGYSAADIGKKAMTDFWDMPAGVVHQVLEAVRSNSLWEGELAHRKKSGERFWQHTAISAVADEKGRISHFVQFIQEATKKNADDKVLRESEEKYRSILDSMKEGYFEVDLAGRLTFYNTSVKDFIGRTREELKNFSFRDYMTSGEADRVYAIFNQVYRSGEPSGLFDYTIVRKDGKVVTVEAVISLIRDAKGRASGFAGLGRDVTKRRQMEAALRKSEEKYRHIIESLEEGYSEIDLKGRFLYVNPSVCRKMGYSAEELIGLNYRHYVAPDVLDHSAKTYNRVYRTGEPARIKGLKTITGDGSVRISDVSISLLRDADGAPTGFRTITMDRTREEAREQALRESEESYRRVLEAAPYSIVILRLSDSRYMQVNDAFCQRTGYSREEAIGSTPLDLNLYLRREDRDRLLAEFYEKGRVDGYEVSHKLRDGRVIHNLLSAVPLRFRGQDCMLVLTTDITDKKRLEAQLLQAQKMEAIGTLAGGIAHDFSNLMQAILGYCQILLLDKPEDSPDAQKLTRIERATHQAIQFTRQLLTFGRKMEIQRKPVDVNRVVRQVRQLLKRTIPKMIDIELRLAPSVFTVNADAGQLEQVILNIGVNARDAMPEGGRLIIETENMGADEAAGWLPDKPPEPCVMLKVRDTGCGMSEEVCAHIFEPFYTTKPVGEGTGLGLAMAYGIIDNHGGSICCSSQPGEGTRFHICLPAIDAPVAEEPEQGEAVVPQGAGETILVIDDEAFLREFVEAMLTSNGYRVMAGGSGEEGLELYQRHQSKIQVVILDLLMPGMGGRQCLDELLRFDPAARVIVSSGKGPRELDADPLLSRASSYIQKPYEVSDMLELIREVLESKAR